MQEIHISMQERIFSLCFNNRWRRWLDGRYLYLYLYTDPANSNEYILLFRYSSKCLAEIYRAQWGVSPWYTKMAAENKQCKHLELTLSIWATDYCWLSHDVTKFQTSELLILLRFYFHDIWEQLKTNIPTNFHSEWVFGLVIDYAWISKFLCDMAFTWRTRKLWCWLK